jgi:transcriptional regulator with XRE-family HTH domain
MNPIEKLSNDLASRFPGAVLEIDAPADESGVWQLDVRPAGGGPWLVVEWKASQGFGVSTPGPDDYGLKPDELYPNVKATYDRVVRLVLSAGRTEPPAAVTLAEMRQALGLSQTEVADRAGVKQPAVARAEGRADILLSTLNRIITSMGGTISIQAQFPEGKRWELANLFSGPPGPPTRSQILTETQPAPIRIRQDETFVRDQGPLDPPIVTGHVTHKSAGKGAKKGRGHVTHKSVGEGEKSRS